MRRDRGVDPAECPRQVGMIALGCPKNLVDAELMLGSLIEHGYRLTAHPAQADLLIVNTCSFIGEARQESMDAIREAGRWKQKGRCQALVVTGCLPQLCGEQLLDELPEVDAVVGVSEFPRLPEILQSLSLARQAEVGAPVHFYPEGQPRALATPPWSAYLKIAEGCDLGCTFCIIPQIRGRFRSRPLEALVAEADELAQRGVRELVLVAEDTTYYGEDLSGRSLLPDLLEALAAVRGIAWIRLHYAYPTRVTDQLIEAMATIPQVCAYLDVPLQHGDDEILRRMARRGRRQDYLDLIRRLRAALPDVALRSTFMVGFPGEERRHFRNLLSFLEEAQLEWAGFFRYSREPLAPSSRFEGQVHVPVAERRLSEAQALQRRVSWERQRQWIGRTLEVVVEAEVNGKPTTWKGRSPREAPDIDGVVEFTSSTPLTPGQFVLVHIHGATPSVLRGEIADQQPAHAKLQKGSMCAVSP